MLNGTFVYFCYGEHLCNQSTKSQEQVQHIEKKKKLIFSGHHNGFLFPLNNVPLIFYGKLFSVNLPVYICI